MPRYSVTVTVIEQFRIVIDAPTEGLARCRAEDARVHDGLQEHFAGTQDVGFEVEADPDSAADLVVEAGEDAEELLATYEWLAD